MHPLQTIQQNVDFPMGQDYRYAAGLLGYFYPFEPRQLLLQHFPIKEQ